MGSGLYARLCETQNIKRNEREQTYFLDVFHAKEIVLI